MENSFAINLSDYKVVFFKNQNYAQLKRECLRAGRLFEDPLFRPIENNLYYSKRLPRGLKWLRPHDIMKNRKSNNSTKPKFIENSANANDLDQGFLGNCWFVAGCAAITYIPELFRKVVPMNQEFEDGKYAGIFHFRFWLYGQWTDVTIDDYLPVWEDNRLAFCSNREEPNEFWAALLEKAYAKVCGSYENLEGGFTTDILIDLTGGLEENFTLTDPTMKSQSEKDRLWKILTKAREQKSMNGCYIEPDPNVHHAKLPNGLVKGHAYTVTNMASVIAANILSRNANTNNRPLRMIRLRNPWGNEQEWRGAWSDNSAEFANASAELKRTLDYRKENEGEFWMSFDDDFYSNFDLIQFCHLTPDALSEEIAKASHNASISWNVITYHGEWVAGVTAGGSGNGGDRRYWTNPQYLIKLVDVDLDDEEDVATVIVALMQKNTREKRLSRGGQSTEEHIQFRLFRVRDEKDVKEAIERRSKLMESQLERVGNSGSYVNKREITKRFRVTPGYYVIIPSTYDPNTNGQFLLRIFTEKSLLNANNKRLVSHKVLGGESQVNNNNQTKTWINSLSSRPDDDDDNEKVEFTSSLMSSPSYSGSNHPGDRIEKENFKFYSDVNNRYRSSLRAFK